MPQATKKAKKTAIRPIADHVVVRRIEDSVAKKGSLFIPDTAKEKPQQGEVIAVGPGRYDRGARVPMELSAGSKVLYGKYSGSEVVIDDEEYLIIKESDVLAVIG